MVILSQYIKSKTILPAKPFYKTDETSTQRKFALPTFIWQAPSQNLSFSYKINIYQFESANPQISKEARKSYTKTFQSQVFRKIKRPKLLPARPSYEIFNNHKIYPQHCLILFPNLTEEKT